MPDTKPSSPRPTQLVLLTVVLLLCVACLAPPVRLGIQFLGLGIKHGAADSRSGITYATGDAGWRIVRNGVGWTPDDRELVQILAAASPPASSRYASLFQLGYKCGTAGALFGLGLLLGVVLLGAVLFDRNRSGRTRQTLL